MRNDLGRFTHKLSRRYKFSNKVTTKYNSTLSKDQTPFVIHVNRNIPYSLNNPYNVMDVYQLSPSTITTHVGSSPATTKVLFVHGGMWMFGSKDHETPSMIEFMRGLASLTLNHSKDDSISSNSSTINPLFRKTPFSSVGALIASQGRQAYIINYRLVSSLFQTQYTVTATINDENRTREQLNTYHHSLYSEQALDVARSIAFLIQQERNERQNLASTSSKRRPTIFITGMSAGAHLTSLVLTNMSFLHRALAEANIDPQEILLEEYIAGFIGFSGPYNLRRLLQSLFSDLIVGPAFFGKGLPIKPSSRKQFGPERPELNKLDNEYSIDSLLDESSPIHVLLSSSKRKNHQEVPILCKIPLLLINAKDDFHLSQDSQELLIALSHYPSSKNDTERVHRIIPSTTHLNLMKEFAIQGYDCEVVDDKVIKLQRRDLSTSEKKSDSGWISDLWSYLPLNASDSSNNKKEDSLLLTNIVFDFMTRVTQRE